MSPDKKRIIIYKRGIYFFSFSVLGNLLRLLKYN